MAQIPAEVVGAYDDLGGVITVEWVAPNTPEEVAGDLVKLAGYLDNVHKPLLAAGAIARADIKAHFDTERDPDGNAWVALNDDYLARKEAAGDDTRILRKSGELFRAATATPAFVVGADSLFYDTSGLPFYWEWMQEGTATSFGSTAELLAAVGDENFQFGGRGKNTPARPFIGISAEAEEQILNVFDLWFAEGVQIAISGSGTVQERGSGGRFGKTVFPDMPALMS